MTTFQNDFNGGTDGAGTTGAITTGNSVNSGDAFNTITIGTPANGTFAYDATGARAGLGGRWHITAATTWRAYHSWTGVTSVAGRVVFTLNTSVPGTAMILAGCITGSTFGTAVRVALNTSSQLVVQDFAGATQATMTGTLSAGTTYVAEYQVAIGSTISNGTAQVQLYTVAAPGTLLINYATTTGNAGGATNTTLVRGQLGNNDSVTALDITYDDVTYVTGTLTPVGPPSTATSASAGLAAATGVPPAESETIALNMTIQGI